MKFLKLLIRLSQASAKISSQLLSFRLAFWASEGKAGSQRIHFTIQGKRAAKNDEAAVPPRLPEDWHASVVIL